MSELLNYILSLSLSGTVLILILFLCKPLLKTMPNKRWQYYLWLIVIARLLIPFAPKMSLVPASFLGEDRAVVQVTTGAGDHIPFTVPAEEGGDFLPQAAPVEDNGDALWAPEALEVFMTMLWIVWLTGAVFLFTRKIIAYLRFVKGVKKGASQISDPRLLDLLSECGEQIGVKRPVELAVNGAVSSPMLIGFYHPCIILSTVDLTETDFRYIFLHELTHERRWDIPYKWLIQFTLCVHWFNPFVWLMSREIDRACELACDEAVISKLGSRERIEYGDMLMNAVRIEKSGSNLSGFVALYESNKMIRERLGAIMDFHKKSKWVTLGSISLAFCLLAAAVIAGAYLVPSFTISAEESGTGAAVSADEDTGISSGITGGWEVEDSIAEAVKHVTVHNECSMLGEAEVSHISNTTVRNVLETHAGIYSFDNVEVTLYNQFEENGRLVVDVEVGAIMTLIRDPLESPYVRGMKAAMEEYEDLEEREAARQILEAYLKDAGQYYNVPGDYATGFSYRVYISGLDGNASTVLEFEFYHRSGPDDDPSLTYMAEHETFTEVFTEESGWEFMMEEVERATAAVL